MFLAPWSNAMSLSPAPTQYSDRCSGLHRKTASSVLHAEHAGEAAKSYVVGNEGLELRREWGWKQRCQGHQELKQERSLPRKECKTRRAREQKATTTRILKVGVRVGRSLTVFSKN